MKDFHVRRGAHWVVMSLFLAVAACGGDSGTNGDNGNNNGNDNGNNNDPVAQTTVTVSDNSFGPASIQVSPGATVTWTWSGGGGGHNVTFGDNAITSSDNQNQTSGTYATAMPTMAGVYGYQCTNHAGMDGTVTVTAQ